MKTYDVIVAGGGPGGATAALSLAKLGLSVAVLEKDRHPRFHIGESLLPRNLPLLKELELERAVDDLPHLPKFGAMFLMANAVEPAKMGFDQGLLPGTPTFNVERAAFDHMLLRKAEAAGAEVFEGTPVKSIDRLEAGDVRVTTAAGQFAGRMLIDASGHGTLVGRHFDRRKAVADEDLKRVAYFEHFESVGMPTGQEAGSPLLVMADEGWFWMIGIDADRTSVGFVAKPGLCKELGVPADAMLQWAAARAPAVRERMRNSRGPAANKVLADFSYSCAPFAGPGYFLVGDAGAFLDPIFSTGVTLAMMTGHEAAKHTAAILRGTRKPKSAWRDYTRFFKTSTGVFFKLIRGYYRHSFRELILAQGGPFKVRPAVISVLAGQVFPKPKWALRWRLAMFHGFVKLQAHYPCVPRHARWSMRSAAATPATTLLDRLRQHAADAPDRPAFVEPCGRTLTYGELLGRAETLARELCDGEPRMLRCPNRAEFAAWFFAAQLAGVELAIVPCGTTAAEADRLAARAGVRQLVGGDFPGFDSCRGLELRDGSGQRRVGPRGGILLSSSGSTAEPSLVRRSAVSLDAVARNVAACVGLTPGDRVLATVPLAHSYGLEHGLLGPIWAGATVLLNVGLDAGQLRRQLARKPTVIPAVPAMIEMLPKLADDPLVAGAVRAARCVYSAGAPLPAEARDAFLETFGQRVGQVYGMTEIGSVTFNDPADADFDPASVGRPLDGVSVRLLDEGEVAVRSTCMFDGYVDRDADLVDGHLRTGDLGALDADGRLTVTGRKRLLIDTGGQKVNPLEVEAALRSHPLVADCVVVPVHQTATTQRLRALVVPRGDVTAAEVREHVRSRLAGWKVPRVVEFRESLAYTASGKLARAELEAS